MPSADPGRILVLRRHAVGDVLVSLAVPAALKRHWPQARIHMVVDRSVAPVARDLPFVDQLLVYHPRRYREGGPLARLRAARQWLRRLRALRYDVVVDLLGTPQTALWSRWSGAAIRVGRRRALRTWAYTHVVDTSVADRFAGDCFLDLVRALGVQPVEWHPVGVPAAAEHLASAAQDLNDRTHGRPRVILNPAATWSAKAWPLSHYAALARGLAAATGAPALVSWGPGEEAIRDTVVGLAGGAARALPATDLPTLAAYLQQADLVVTGCAGPKHLAVAQSTPTLTLFGSTDPVGWQPPGALHRWLTHDVPCRPCNLTTCPVAGHPCLDDLPVQRVLEQALSMLQRTQEAAS